MGLTFHLGKTLLCSALLLQGLFIMGIIPNTSFPNAIQKGFELTGQSLRITKQPAYAIISEHIPLIAKVIGGLLAAAGLNIIVQSRAIIKLNILALFVLTLLIGIPWKWIESKGSFFDPSDKAVFHLITNWGLIGGLIYWHSTIKPRKH